jgi:hypothetical protein
MGTKCAFFLDDLPRMLPTKFWFIWQSGFREEHFSEINQSEMRIACGDHVCWRIGTKLAIFIEELLRMLPSKVRFIWPSVFREEFFFNQPIINKNCLWRPCLLTDRGEMDNLYRGPAIDVSYQVSVHLAKRFQRRIFF